MKRSVSTAAAAAISVARFSVLPVQCDERQIPGTAAAPASPVPRSRAAPSTPWFRGRFISAPSASSIQICPLVQDDGWPAALQDFSHSDMSIRVASASETNVLGEHLNEDRTVFVSRADAFHPFCIAGVLDGHCGSFVVDFVSRNVGHKVAERLEAGSKVSTAFANTFYWLEEDLRSMHMNIETSVTSGCCMLLVVLSPPYAWCANLGDCRAFYIPLPQQSIGTCSLQDSMVLLSRDLKGSELHEADRIRTAGGRIQSGRVLGLEPTRTLGDFEIKNQLPMGVISIVPEVRRLGTQSPSTGLIIMATDGVWDVMSEIEIANIVAPHFPELHELAMKTPRNATQEDESGDLSKLCTEIVKASQDRGSTDDCTVQVVLIAIQEPRE
eukprot:gnl/MRDRNA2_/MRDRNA2_151079_c0_seq1.p1 gnl/MRDRNA2_/MRDRNA2_151079_c0~~gnl/MRDRNA2_/MRDRNA2_151079_c0_seq1.p1  ORF type:complete len:384 (+),score=47.69 gnl/MRDRNA2_/MRDRNA2_151079_c0_seq1:49-1200(+)